MQFPCRYSYFIVVSPEFSLNMFAVKFLIKKDLKYIMISSEDLCVEISLLLFVVGFCVKRAYEAKSKLIFT